MQWEDFIETQEWITIRNIYLDKVNYRCEICSVQPRTLNIFLHKDTVQSQRYYYSDVNYKYYALCNKCISRCEDLINREKRDSIKKEFLEIIKDWNREHDPYNARY
jgi:Pyruvate/2-oxoacid:ferredoxin oxidoreductase delta subunit